MYDVAIAGGGLCGLAIAEALAGQGLSVVLVEARERLGGRILTHTSAQTGLAVDLGAGWFWPHAQPLFRGLMERLGLRAFPQYDNGIVLTLGNPDLGPQQAGSDSVHGGAYRVAEGLGALIAALADRLAGTHLRLGQRLAAVRDAGDHLRLRLQTAAGDDEIEARQLVLAIPPRLVATGVAFSPPLAPAIVSGLEQTPTWMAASAKAVLCYEVGGWRDSGLSGSAFVSNERAVLAELFDACDETGEHPALGGFLALSPDLRTDFADGLPMLIANQVAQVFGPEYELGELHYLDWATEPPTCSNHDRGDPARPQPAEADPALREPHWDGKLHFGSSETASREPGYMEGALDTAQRIINAVTLAAVRSAVAVVPANQAGTAQFAEWVAAQREPALAVYERRITHRLSTHQRGQLTQLALLETVEAVFAAALAQLGAIPFDTRDVPVENGRSALMPLIQEPFRAFLGGLIEDVMRSNASSCALSNFPGEHNPSHEYEQVILRDIAAAWTEFSKAANALLLAAANSEGGC